MGESLSKPPQSNPSSAPTAASNSDMTSSNSSETPQPKPENEPAHPPKSSESKPPIHETEENPAVNSEKVSEDSIDEENGNEGEEEGECGFCLFMKAGGCKDTFTDWEKCVDDGEKKKEDIVEKCFQETAALKKCMEAHSDYYAPLLQAEKAAEEEAAKQLEQEKDSLNDGGAELGKKESEETSDRSEKKETS